MKANEDSTEEKHPKDIGVKNLVKGKLVKLMPLTRKILVVA